MKIVNYLDLELSDRTRLTADIVTGKVDVRETATKLPPPFLAEALTDEMLEETEEDAEL